MRRLYYDFHIHSCLSPCSDADMTPNNIVGLSKLLGLDAIAVSDHNSTANIKAVIEASKRDGGPIIVPAMELETMEEVHVLCLFPGLDEAAVFDKELDPFRISLKNRPDIFGDQLIMDEYDNVTAVDERLLISALSVDLYTAASMVHRLGGAFVAAHVDRDSHSVLSNLGNICDDMGFDAVELSSRADSHEMLRRYPALLNYRILRNSDAHRLCDISQPVNILEVMEGSAAALVHEIIKKT